MFLSPRQLHKLWFLSTLWKKHQPTTETPRCERFALIICIFKGRTSFESSRRTHFNGMPQGLHKITTKLQSQKLYQQLLVLLILGIFYFAYAKNLSTPAGQTFEATLLKNHLNHSKLKIFSSCFPFCHLSGLPAQSRPRTPQVPGGRPTLQDVGPTPQRGLIVSIGFPKRNIHLSIPPTYQLLLIHDLLWTVVILRAEALLIGKVLSRCSFTSFSTASLSDRLTILFNCIKCIWMFCHYLLMRLRQSCFQTWWSAPFPGISSLKSITWVWD